MELHLQLRDLIAARGPDVVTDPAEFRAALDDYFTDDEISVGDANVLVDAVRLGAVRRLEALLAGGGTPRASVGEAGVALARDRGSDDAARSLRAVAVLGYALGWVGADVLDEVDGRRETVLPPTRVASAAAPSPVAPPAPSVPPPVPPPVLPPATSRRPAPRRRRRRVLVVVLVVVVLVLGLAAWWFVPRGDSPEDVVEQWFAATSCDDLEDLTDYPVTAFIDSGEAYQPTCDEIAALSADYDVVGTSERGDRRSVTLEGTVDDGDSGPQQVKAEIWLRAVDRSLWLPRGRWKVYQVNIRPPDS